MSFTADRFINRELSLLDFQQRVLSLAQNPDLKLLERVKFLAIVSQNLDEFYQVRYAGLLGQQKSGVVHVSPDGLSAREQLALIDTKAEELTEQLDLAFLESILPALEKENIRLANWTDLDADAKQYLTAVFEDQIFPVLTPLAVDPSHPFPYISNLSLNLAVVLQGAEHDIRFARVKVPPILPRFIVLEDGGSTGNASKTGTASGSPATPSSQSRKTRRAISWKPWRASWRSGSAPLRRFVSRSRTGSPTRCSSCSSASSAWRAAR